MLPASGTAPDSGLLAWFGLFQAIRTVESDAMPSCPARSGGCVAFIASTRNFARWIWAKAFAAVQEYIAAGDIYQANLTFPLSADYAGDPLALYAALRPRAAAGYGG